MRSKPNHLTVLLTLFFTIIVLVEISFSKNGFAKPITVKDSLGRIVELKKAAERVAFVHFSTAEALMILDAWDTAVTRDGFTSDKLVYPNLDELPTLSSGVGNMYQPNMEVIYSVDTDLLILEVIPMSGIQNLIERLETDLPVVAVRTYDPNELEVSFKNLGKLLNREREAAEYLAWYKNLNDTMLRKAGKLPEHQKTRLFYKTSFSGPSDVGTLSDKLNYIPARNKTTGCINVASNLPSQGGWVPSVDPEWLASQEIDVLVIGDAQPGQYGFSVNDTSKLADWRSKVMALPVFADTKAVRNERVYMLSESFFGTPRFIVGFAFMAKWCHPELFGDVDPTKIHQEYAMKFLRLGPDIADGGVFVYPEK